MCHLIYSPVICVTQAYVSPFPGICVTGDTYDWVTHMTTTIVSNISCSLIYLIDFTLDTFLSFASPSLLSLLLSFSLSVTGFGVLLIHSNQLNPVNQLLKRSSIKLVSARNVRDHDLEQSIIRSRRTKLDPV